jgi:hypothetical protein
MRLSTPLARTIGLLALLTIAAPSAHAQNVLTNPGFEDGATGYGAGPGWTAFGNVFTEAANPPAIVPYGGNQLVKMFGGFAGGFSVSGFFQSYPAAPGETWSLSSKSRHFSGDAMFGVSVPNGGNGNWVVQKLIFRANGVDDIASTESTILDGSFPTDMWFDNPAVTLVAPPTTTTVWAFLLYLQPANDGGAAQIDDVKLEKVVATPNQSSSWGRIKNLYRN